MPLNLVKSIRRFRRFQPEVSVSRAAPIAVAPTAFHLRNLRNLRVSLVETANGVGWHPNETG